MSSGKTECVFVERGWIFSDFPTVWDRQIMQSSIKLLPRFHLLQEATHRSMMGSCVGEWQVPFRTNFNFQCWPDRHRQLCCRKTKHTIISCICNSLLLSFIVSFSSLFICLYKNVTGLVHSHCSFIILGCIRSEPLPATWISFPSEAG